MGAHNAARGLETGNRALAQPPGGSTDPHAARPHSSQRGREHGLGGRTRGSGDDEGGAHAPRHAGRYVETRLGILSYTELAPHLARRVLALERRLEDGEFPKASLDDALLRQFHRLICGDLVPQSAGWRRTNVIVGDTSRLIFSGYRRLLASCARFCGGSTLRLCGLRQRLSLTGPSIDCVTRCRSERLAVAYGCLGRAV